MNMTILFQSPNCSRHFVASVLEFKLSRSLPLKSIIFFNQDSRVCSSQELNIEIWFQTFSNSNFISIHVMWNWFSQTPYSLQLSHHLNSTLGFHFRQLVALNMIKSKYYCHYFFSSFRLKETKMVHEQWFSVIYSFIYVW